MVSSSKLSLMTSLSFTVVIPTIGRQRLLKQVVSSVAKQRCPVLEIIIVDQTQESLDQRLLADLSVSETSTRVRYFHAPKLRGAAEARNYGAGFAQGDVILFLDDDVEIAGDYLYWLALIFENLEVAGASGMIEDTHIRRVPMWYQWLFRLFYIGEFRQRRQEIWWSDKRKPMLTNTLPGVVAYRRVIWENYKFDEALTGHSIGEDIDLSYRIGKRWLLVIDTRARCLHDPAPAVYKSPRRVMAETIAFYHYHFRKNMEGTCSQWLQFLWVNVGFLFLSLVQLNYGKLLGFFDGWREIFRRPTAYRPSRLNTPNSVA